MVKVGMIIRERTIDGLTKKKTYTNWTVKKIYPYMVLCVNKAGIRTCFSINDLLFFGIVKQSPELEILKEQRNAQYIKQRNAQYIR